MARENLRDKEQSRRSWPIYGVGGELLEHAASPTAFQARERTVAAPPAAALADQLADELEERPPQSRREVQRAEGGKRDDGDPVRRADLPRDGAAADPQREVGDDDAEIPVRVQQLAPRRVDNLRRRSRRRHEAVHRQLGPPLDAQVQRFEVVRELAGDLGRDVARETRRNDHPEGNVRLLLRALPVRGSGRWLRRRLHDRSLVSAGLAPR